MNRNKEMDKLIKAYNNLLKASKAHNILQCSSSIEYIENQVEIFCQVLKGFTMDAEREIAELRSQHSDGQSFLAGIYEALKARNLPVELNDNSIILGPIEIEAKLDDFVLVLGIGRKKMKISDLEASVVIKSIELLYKKINSSFNASTFLNRLIKGYDYLNKSIYASRTVLYGNAIPLVEVFKLFSLSPASADYKIEQFTWDLGRLLSNSYDHPEYQIEFGFSRNAGRMMIIRDTQGIDHRYSTLTVHKRSEANA